MTYPTRRLILAGAALIVARPLHAAGGGNTRINTLAGGRLAIHGYDTVAYFTDGAHRAGRADITGEHAAAVWRFASEPNLSRFLTSPERYVPAYGGYCAYGVSQGYLVKIDPEAWTILGDRLYLNYDLSVRDEWLRDPKRYIAIADRNWPTLAPVKNADVVPWRRTGTL